MNYLNAQERSLFPTFILLLILAGFISCEENVSPIDLAPVSEIIVADNGNEGNASDIEVNFKKQLDLNPIKEYRLFAVKETKASSFDLTSADALSSDFYTSITTTETFPVKGKVLAADAKDTDGEVINKDQAYKFAVLTVAKDSRASENKLAISEEAFRLSINNQLTNFTQESDIGSGNLIIDPNGDLIMSEYNIQVQVSNNTRSLFKIYKIIERGSFVEQTDTLPLLTGSFVDAAFNLYQSEYFGGKILKQNSAGEITEIVHQGEQLFNPDGIYVDENEHIFVADQQAGRILEITPDGVSTQFAFVGLSPKGLTVDEDGNFYVSHNDESGRISKITPDGDVSVLANIPTAIPEGYALPYKMWMGYITYHEGSLYVAGMSTDRIYKISLDGQVEAFAGSGTRGLARGGAKTANMNRPNGLAFSQDGKKLFVSGCTDVTPSHTQYSTPGIIWQIDILE